MRLPTVFHQPLNLDPPEHRKSHIHTCMHTYIHTYIYIYIHIHTHIHIHSGQEPASCSAQPARLEVLRPNIAAKHNKTHQEMPLILQMLFYTHMKHIRKCFGHSSDPILGRLGVPTRSRPAILGVCPYMHMYVIYIYIYIYIYLVRHRNVLVVFVTVSIGETAAVL